MYSATVAAILRLITLISLKGGKSIPFASWSTVDRRANTSAATRKTASREYQSIANEHNEIDCQFYFFTFWYVMRGNGLIHPPTSFDSNNNNNTYLLTLIVNALRLGCHSSKSNSWEYIRVVGLSRHDGATMYGQWSEGRAGRKHSGSIAPVHAFLEGAFCLGSRVGKREDDGTFVDVTHRADHLLVECLGHG
jgi:hypothetical protein